MTLSSYVERVPSHLICAAYQCQHYFTEPRKCTEKNIKNSASNDRRRNNLSQIPISAQHFDGSWVIIRPTLDFYYRRLQAVLIQPNVAAGKRNIKRNHRGDFGETFLVALRFCNTVAAVKGAVPAPTFYLSQSIRHLGRNKPRSSPFYRGRYFSIKQISTKT